MPDRKLSPGLMSELSKAAFKDDRKSYAKLILSASRDDIIAAMPDRNLLLEKLEELAFQEDSAVFKSLLGKFSEDEGAIRAILTGFNRDEKYCGSSNDDWGGPSQHNRDELKKKRAALQKFVLKQPDPEAEDDNTPSADIKPARKRFPLP